MNNHNWSIHIIPNFAPNVPLSCPKKTKTETKIKMTKMRMKRLLNNWPICLRILFLLLPSKLLNLLTTLKFKKLRKLDLLGLIPQAKLSALLIVIPIFKLENLSGSTTAKFIIFMAIRNKFKMENTAE